MRTCSVAGCERVHLARGWCDAHYQRWERYGDPQADKPIGYTQDVDHIEPMPCRLYTNDYTAIKNLPAATMLTYDRRMKRAQVERGEWESESHPEYDRQAALWRGEAVAA